jgi:hypothetical protein
MALAFGLGGRDVAGRMLSEAYDRERANTGRFRRDDGLAQPRPGYAVTGTRAGGAGDGTTGHQEQPGTRSERTARLKGEATMSQPP